MTDIIPAHLVRRLVLLHDIFEIFSENLGFRENDECNYTSNGSRPEMPRWSVSNSVCMTMLGLRLVFGDWLCCVLFFERSFCERMFVEPYFLAPTRRLFPIWINSGTYNFYGQKSLVICTTVLWNFTMATGHGLSVWGRVASWDRVGSLHCITLVSFISVAGTQFPRNTQKSNALHSSLSYPMRIAFLSAVASVKQYQPERRRSALCGLRNVGVAVAAAALLLSNTDAAHAYGLTRAGRLDKCHGDEACVSTSSVGNPVKFGPPWTYEPQTSDATEAWATLKNAVLQNKDKGKIIEAIDGPEIYYMRAEYPSFAGGTEYVDLSIVSFVHFASTTIHCSKGHSEGHLALTPSCISALDVIATFCVWYIFVLIWSCFWFCRQSDVEFRLLPRDHLVTYRSASRKAIFVYPLQVCCVCVLQWIQTCAFVMFAQTGALAMCGNWAKNYLSLTKRLSLFSLNVLNFAQTLCRPLSTQEGTCRD